MKSGSSGTWTGAFHAGARSRVAVAALLLVAALPGIARLESDNSPRVFFVRDSPELATYDRFRAAFGSDTVLRVVVEGPSLWSREGLTWTGELESRLSGLDGVERAVGPRGRFAPLGPWPPAAEGFRERVMADPLARQAGLVGRSGERLTLLAFLAETDPRTEAALLDAIQGELASAPPGVETRLVGAPVLDRALDGSSREVETRFFPLLVLAAALLLALVLRSLGGILIPLAFVGWVEGVTLGAMGYLGVRLNLVLAVLPPLLFVIGLATALHLLLRYRAHLRRQTDPASALEETYREKAWAVLWTGLSTMIGFASLTVSPVGPVRSLGIWSGIGIAVLTAGAFLVYPAMLDLAGGGARARRAWGGFEAWGRRQGRVWAEWVGRRRVPVLVASGALAALAAAGLPRLQVESNALSYLAPDHPVRAGIEELEADGIGSASVELFLGLPPERLARPETEWRLAELADALRGIPGVLGAVGPGEVAGALEESGVSGTPAGVMLRRAALAPFLDAEAGLARISLSTPTAGTERIDPLVAEALAVSRRLLPEAEVAATGELSLLLQVQRHLLSTLALSLPLTVGAILLLFRLLLGTSRLTLLALLPNLWPVLLVLGAMGWLGLPLDIATVMVASVVLGLAVDDTLHTLAHYRHLAHPLGRRGAVAATLERTAGSYLLTGGILAAGFAICGLSDFAPISRFGILSAAGITLAVVGDLLVVPALLASAPRRAIEKMHGL